MGKEKKENLRQWMHPYWKKNDILNVLKEIIEPDSIDVTSIQFHDTLSPILFDENGKLKDDVRKQLIKIAVEFIKFCGLEEIKFDDIIIVGSMVNFNYHEDSDIDLHLIFDFSQINNDKEFVSDYLKDKKTLFNSIYDIQIKGHDVELYAQNSSEKVFSSGTYSILKDEWVIKPTKKIIEIPSQNIQLKASQFMTAIDKLSKIENPEEFDKQYQKLKEKLKKYRRKGLKNSGEYSTENLVFKILRNNGYLNHLFELKRKFKNKELSLVEEQ